MMMKPTKKAYGSTKKAMPKKPKKMAVKGGKKMM